MQGSIMIQGTASSAGKSLLNAALCRILAQDGFRAVPFKSQNMALNSYVTAEGLEMGRAQAVQAEAAYLEPRVEMNPVLLKPTSDRGSQVIVQGRPVDNMEAGDYLAWREKLLPVIMESYRRLQREHDVVVLEGAGSPAEINLKRGDLVNMGLARQVKTPVLLVGDIDRGGVFASLYGTVKLLPPGERSLIKGVVINKFRGDVSVLEPGLRELEELLEGIPVLGVVPYLELNLDDEDSVTDRFQESFQERSPSRKGEINVQVLQLPRLSNFTDFNPLETEEDVNLSYIRRPAELNRPDIIIIPGSKNTIQDLLYLKEHGWEEPLRGHVEAGGLLIGICGGFQMLGRKLQDPHGVESTVESASGLGFLDLETVMQGEKSTRRVEATWHYRDEGYFAGMQEEPLSGYEIHMGRTFCGEVIYPLFVDSEGYWEGAVNPEGNILGTYLHGIFDNPTWRRKLLNNLRRRKGIGEKEETRSVSYREHKEKEYDRLAEAVRGSLDMEKIYRIIEEGNG